MLEMTKDFEMLNEFPIEVDNNGEGLRCFCCYLSFWATLHHFLLSLFFPPLQAVPISVGWGKKETQFHGSLGKYVNQKKEDLSPSLSEDDDRKPRLSWRGDAQFFVCSTINEGGDKRILRIYNRECVLQSTSEDVPKLEHPLCWRPSGNLITGTQKLSQRHDVVFFEKNGLRHGEFALRDDCRVTELAWNSDSSILALAIVKPTGSFCKILNHPFQEKRRHPDSFFV